MEEEEEGELKLRHKHSLSSRPFHTELLCSLPFAFLALKQRAEMNPHPSRKACFQNRILKKNHVEILKRNAEIALRRPTADQTLAAPRVQVFSSEGSVGIGGPVAGEPT